MELCTALEKNRTSPAAAPGRVRPAPRCARSLCTDWRSQASRWPPKRPRPKSAAISSRTIRRSRSGRPTSWPTCARCSMRRRPTCRWGCTCTFRFAASAASSVISASTPTRTPPTSKPMSRPCRARSNWSAGLPVMGGPAVSLRLFRRRHALVPQRQATHVAGRPAAGQHPLGPCRGSHLRVRAGHAFASRRSHTLRELGVTRLSLGVENFGDAVLEENGRAHLSAEVYKVLGLDSGRRLSQRQHRSDLRHGRRDLGQLERQRPPDHRAFARQRHDLSDGAAVQHGLFQGHAGPARRIAGGRLADQAGLGRLRLRRIAWRPATPSRAPTRW